MVWSIGGYYLVLYTKFENQLNTININKINFKIAFRHIHKNIYILSKPETIKFKVINTSECQIGKKISIKYQIIISNSKIDIKFASQTRF